MNLDDILSALDDRIDDVTNAIVRTVLGTERYNLMRKRKNERWKQKHAKHMEDARKYLAEIEEEKKRDAEKAKKMILEKEKYYRKFGLDVDFGDLTSTIDVLEKCQEFDDILTQMEDEEDDFDDFEE